MLNIINFIKGLLILEWYGETDSIPSVQNFIKLNNSDSQLLPMIIKIKGIDSFLFKLIIVSHRSSVEILMGGGERESEIVLLKWIYRNVPELKLDSRGFFTACLNRWGCWAICTKRKGNRLLWLRVIPLYIAYSQLN